MLERQSLHLQAIALQNSFEMPIAKMNRVASRDPFPRRRNTASVDAARGRGKMPRLRAHTSLDLF